MSNKTVPIKETFFEKLSIKYKDRILGFIAKNFEVLSVGLFVLLIIANILLYVAKFLIAAVSLSIIIVVSIGAFVLIVITYKKWEDSIDKYNETVEKTPLKANEHIQNLTLEQYADFVKNGYVILPDGTAVTSSEYKKSGKMKHIKLQDAESLNGAIITDANKNYDGVRVLDYEEKYGKSYGIPVKGTSKPVDKRKK